MPHGPVTWSQGHRWAAPARAFGWSAPVGAWFLAPHPLVSSIACLPAAQWPTGTIRRGGTPGPCLLWRSQLEHQSPLRQSAGGAPSLHGFTPACLETFLENDKTSILVHFHEDDSRLHRFVERCHHQAAMGLRSAGNTERRRHW